VSEGCINPLLSKQLFSMANYLLLNSHPMCTGSSFSRGKATRAWCWPLDSI